MNVFDERSYAGKLFRPKPEVHLEEDGSFGVIATPWGPRNGAKRAIEILKDYVLSARQDMEATSPFQKLTCLSPLANSLRVGMMLANDSLYREENKSEYISGVEVLVFAHQQNELAFAQVGHPNIYLARPALPWIPLSVQVDLATEISEPEATLAPLPQNVIGLHTTTNLNISSFKTQPGDRLIFLSHSLAASTVYSTPFEKSNMDQISSSLAQRHPHLPFWLGVYSFG
jgi:hypothetical protein